MAVNDNPNSFSTDSINPDIFKNMSQGTPIEEEVIEEPIVEEEEETVVEDEFEEPKKEPVKKEVKKEEVSVEEPEDDDNIIGGFKAKYGEVEGEFEDSFEGVTSYIDKVLEKNKESFLLEGQEILLETQPELKALKEHLDNGYALNSFMQKQQMTDWSKLEFKAGDEKSEKLAEDVYRHALVIKGVDEDEVEDMVTLAKDNGTIIPKGENATKFLAKKDEEIIKAQQDAEKAQHDELVKQEKAYLEEANTILKSGSILGVTLTGEQIKELRKFSLEVDNKGISERDKKIQSMTIEQSLLLDLILKDDFKLLGAIKPKSSKDLNEKFKQLKKQNDEKKKPTNIAGATTKPDIKTMFQ